MRAPDPTTKTIALEPSDQERQIQIRNRIPASDFASIEVLGSAPVWVLSGLRLERTGSRLVSSGWEVGVFHIGRAKDRDRDSSEE